MPKSMVITFSIDSEYLKKFESLRDKANQKNSRLFRMFINYFNENYNEFIKLIEGGYDNC